MTSFIKKCFSVFVFSLFIAALFSCDDLESTIEKSRNSVTLYSNTLFWDGYKIGYADERYMGADLNAFKQRLKKSGDWKEVTIMVSPARTESYIDSNGKHQTRYISAVYESTSLSIANIFDLNKQLRYTIGTMSVPEEGARLFILDQQSNQMAAVNSPVNSWMSVLNQVAGKTIQPDYELYERKTPPGKDFRTDFTLREQITLQNDTVETKGTVHITAGLQYFFFKAGRNDSVEKKSDSYLDINVKPFRMFYFDGETCFPLLFFRWDFKYANYKGGKAITGKDAREELGKKSYLLDVAGGFYGVESKVMIQKWYLGQAKYYVSSKRGTWTKDHLEEVIPFTLEKRQIDILYHPIWRDIPRLGGQARSDKALDWYFGYRYMSFDRPSIVYKTKHIAAEEGVPEDTQILGESLPQNIRIHNHLLGIGLNNFQRAARPGLNILYNIDFYAGRFNTKVYLNESYNTLPCRGELSGPVFASFGSLGLQYNIAGKIMDVAVKGSWGFDGYVLMMPDKYSTDYDSILFHNFSLSVECFF
jgi:hypothetical protein